MSPDTLVEKTKEPLSKRRCVDIAPIDLAIVNSSPSLLHREPEPVPEQPRGLGLFDFDDDDEEEEVKKPIDETLKESCPCHKGVSCPGYAECECDCDYCEAKISESRTKIDMEFEEEAEELEEEQGLAEAEEASANQ